MLLTKKAKYCFSLDTDPYHADQIMPGELVHLRELMMAWLLGLKANCIHGIGYVRSDCD